MLAEQVHRTVRVEPIRPLGLDVLNEQRAVGLPERALGELKAARELFDRFALRSGSESPASLRIGYTHLGLPIKTCKTELSRAASAGLNHKSLVVIDNVHGLQ